MKWTLVDTATRLVSSAGDGGRPPSPGAGEALILGVRGDARRQMATADFTALEARPRLVVSATSATVGVGEAVTLACSEPFVVAVRELGDAATFAASGTVSFSEPGTYRLRVRPEGLSVALPGVVNVTVTPGGTPVATDLVVPERRDSLADDVRAKLPDFDLGISRAQAREVAAEEIRTRTITTQAEAVAALRDLAAVERQTNNDLALMIGYIRRATFALVEIATRGR